MPCRTRSSSSNTLDVSLSPLRKDVATAEADAAAVGAECSVSRESEGVREIPAACCERIQYYVTTIILTNAVLPSVCVCWCVCLMAWVYVSELLLNWPHLNIARVSGDSSLASSD